MSKRDKSIVKWEDPRSVAAFLEQSTIKVAEALTGLLTSSRAELTLSAGRIVQAFIKRRLLDQVGKELNEYIKKGEIKEDYLASNKNQASLQELLKFIDEEVPDEERFKAMKSIFFSSVSKDADEREEEIGHQLLKICKKLDSMDLLVLKVCYEIYQENDSKYAAVRSHGEWINMVSERIDYGLPELVGQSDEKLVNLGLLTERTSGDKSGIRTGREFRLTGLALKLCGYITKYE